MQRRDPHIIHFQEFENLERDCHTLLSRGKSEECLAVLSRYVKIHKTEEWKKNLISLSSQYHNNQSAYSKGIISRQEYIQESNKINSHVLDFIPQLTPPDFREYQHSSLRRKSKWDERGNLTVCLQFDRDFSQLDKLFKSFEMAWRHLIQIGSYAINENGEEILLGVDLEDEKLPTGVGRGEKVLLPEDFEEQDELEDENQTSIHQLYQEEQDDLQNTNQSPPEIRVKDLRDENALRIKKNYSKQIPTVDEFEHEGVDVIEESAWAVIEKAEIRFQVWISTVGPSEAKCTLVNELLEWFEKHELFAKGSSDRFTVCIPQAIGFRALESSPTEVSIFMKQPV